MQCAEIITRFDYRRIKPRTWREGVSYIGPYLMHANACARTYRMKYLFAERCRGNPHRTVSRGGTRDHLDNRGGGSVAGMVDSGPGTGNDRR